MLRLVALAAIISGSFACSSDDGDTRGPGGDGCDDVVGSCRSGTVCIDYAGIDPDMVEPSCTDRGTWSDDRCAAGSLGGCQTDDLQTGCATSWYYAPATEQDLEQFCQLVDGTLITAAQ